MIDVSPTDGLTRRRDADAAAAIPATARVDAQRADHPGRRQTAADVHDPGVDRSVGGPYPGPGVPGELQAPAR